MDVLLFTLYVLMWPAMAAGVLVLIITAFTRDILRARREGTTRDIV